MKLLDAPNVQDLIMINAKGVITIITFKDLHVIPLGNVLKASFQFLDIMFVNNVRDVLLVKPDLQIVLNVNKIFFWICNKPLIFFVFRLVLMDITEIVLMKDVQRVIQHVYSAKMVKNKKITIIVMIILIFI